MNTDPAAWLAAQFDADEQVARAAFKATLVPWEVRARLIPVVGCRCLSCNEVDEAAAEVWPIEDADGETTYFQTDVARHIGTHDPGVTLRRVAGLRAILSRHRCIAAPDADPPITGLCLVDNELWPCPDVRALLSIYEGRKGFDPAWKMLP